MDIDEFSSLSKSQLREAVSRLASAANKRLKRLEETNLTSPATLEVKDSGGKFGTRGKSEIELQVEYRRVSNFLRNKTSTVTGARKLENETRQELETKYGIILKQEDYNELLQGFKEIANESPDYISRALRYKYLKEYDITLADNKMTTTDISDIIASELNRYYSVGGSQYDGVAKYFGFD